MIYTSASRLIELLSRREENNPFVAWNNLGAGATLSGTTPISGGELANAVTGSTYDKWRAQENGSGGAVLQFDFGTAMEIRFASLVAHNVGTLGASVSVQRSPDASTWTTPIAAISPDDDAPLVWRLSSGVSARYWRFLFSGIPEDQIIAVGVAFLGLDLVVPRRFYQGFAPVITPTEVQLQSNVSQGNELLGSSVVSRGSRLSATIDHIPAEFIRGDDWLSFQRSFNDGKGFLFGWRPQKYPQDVHYCWRDGGVIRPENSGPRDLMSVSISARARNNG